jgi:2-polyprenyl-3-methyl-5-hydroxy-6-metoxy-1,4-benzoquinol methylase
MPLEFNGIATLSDLQTKEWRDIYQSLEVEQGAFLAKDHLFRSREYPWPRDPLHTWSRVWEYPYVYFQIQHWLKTLSREPVAIADVGSGVTFFPFCITRLGAKVICTDNDPIVERDIRLAASAVELGPGTLEFRLADGQSLPFGNAEVDAIYCISVLEHVSDIISFVREMARSLKPNGLLILTMDLDLRGDQELSVERRMVLNNIFAEYFGAGAPYRLLCHPGEMLSSDRGLYPVRSSYGLWQNIKQYVIKPLLGRTPTDGTPFHLAVEGLVLVRNFK